MANTSQLPPVCAGKTKIQDRDIGDLQFPSRTPDTFPFWFQKAAEAHLDITGVLHVLVIVKPAASCSRTIKAKATLNHLAFPTKLQLLQWPHSGSPEPGIALPSALTGNSRPHCRIPQSELPNPQSLSTNLTQNPPRRTFNLPGLSLSLYI